MSFLRITRAEPLQDYILRLTLTDCSVVERKVFSLLVGPVFEQIRTDPALFAQVRVEGGTVTWPNGADLCPDVLIWGGPPPNEEPQPAPPPQV